jgi:hypothetical protein
MHPAPRLAILIALVTCAGGCGRTRCEPEDCGPAPGMPAYTCEDGGLGGNTGRCLQTDAGTCGWEVHDCPPR